MILLHVISTVPRAVSIIDHTLSVIVLLGALPTATYLTDHVQPHLQIVPSALFFVVVRPHTTVAEGSRSADYLARDSGSIL